MKQPRPRYRQPLPDDVNPPDFTRCVKIYLPDDLQWITTFWGHFWGLAKAYTFENDNAHSAIPVASIWRDIWQSARTRFDNGDCGLETIEYRMNDCGLVEFSIDGGNTWQTVADLRTCFILRSPYDDTNEIYPQGNYRALILRARAGNTAPLMSVYDIYGATPIYIEPSGSGINIGGVSITYYAAGQLWVRDGTLVRWQSVSHRLEGGYGQYIDFQNGTGTLYAEHTDNYNFLVRAYNYLRLFGDNGLTEVKIGGNFITIPSLFGQSKADDTHTQALRRRAAQTAFIVRYEESDGTLLSGIDDKARIVLSSTTGEPSDEPTEGTTAFDSADEALWVRANSRWIRLTENTVQTPFSNFQDRPLPGQTTELWLYCPADGYVMLPFLLEENDIIEVTDCRGWWTDEHWQPTSSSFPFPDTDNFMGFHSDGSLYNAPKGVNEGLSDSSDPCADFYHMALMYSYNRDFSGVEGNDYDYADGMNLTVLLPWADFPRMWFFPNTSQFDGSNGGISFLLRFTAHTGTTEYFSQAYQDGTATWHNEDPAVGWSSTNDNLVTGYGEYGQGFRFYTDDTYTTFKPVRFTVLDLAGFTVDMDNTLYATPDYMPHYGIPPLNTDILYCYLFSTTSFTCEAIWES